MSDHPVIKRARQLLGRAVDTAVVPVQVATSKPAQKAYLGTLLFAIASCILIAVSTVAYALFYYNYIPQIGVERVIHLQFGDGFPHGVASLDASLVSNQPYDISLYLHLPRTPSNLAAGNFMLDAKLLAPPLKPPKTLTAGLDQALRPNDTVIAQSRRPAILTYVSPLVDTASTLSGIPFYVLGWKTESEVLRVPVFESVGFAKGWTNIPESVQVSIEADQKMQFYEVGVKIIARFGGLRWIIYNHRILSYLFFTSIFWTCSMLSTLLAWYFTNSILSGDRDPDTKKEALEDQDGAVKTEEEDEQFDPFSTEDLSDTSRSFPTLGRQMPLHYSSRRDVAKRGKDGSEEEVKREDDNVIASASIQPLGVEADDEDEDDDGRGIRSWRDSGIGTSLEEGDRRNVHRRRTSMLSGDK